MGEKVQGFRSIIGQVQNRQGDVKNSTGNGETKELTSITHEHALSGSVAGGRGDWVEEGEGGKVGTTVIASSIKYV